STGHSARSGRLWLAVHPPRRADDRTAGDLQRQPRRDLLGAAGDAADGADADGLSPQPDHPAGGPDIVRARSAAAASAGAGDADADRNGDAAGAGAGHADAVGDRLPGSPRADDTDGADGRGAEDSLHRPASDYRNAHPPGARPGTEMGHRRTGPPRAGDLDPHRIRNTPRTGADPVLRAGKDHPQGPAAGNAPDLRAVYRNRDGATASGPAGPAELL